MRLIGHNAMHVQFDSQVKNPQHDPSIKKSLAFLRDIDVLRSQVLVPDVQIWFTPAKELAVQMCSLQVLARVSRRVDLQITQIPPSHRIDGGRGASGARGARGGRGDLDYFGVRFDLFAIGYA